MNELLHILNVAQIIVFGSIAVMIIAAVVIIASVEVFDYVIPRIFGRVPDEDEVDA